MLCYSAKDAPNAYSGVQNYKLLSKRLRDTSTIGRSTAKSGLLATHGGPDQHCEGEGGWPPRGVKTLLQGPPPHPRVHIRGDFAPGTQFRVLLMATWQGFALFSRQVTCDMLQVFTARYRVFPQLADLCWFALFWLERWEFGRYTGSD